MNIDNKRQLHFEFICKMNECVCMFVAAAAMIAIESNFHDMNLKLAFGAIKQRNTYRLHLSRRTEGVPAHYRKIN